MRTLLILPILLLASCRSAPPPDIAFERSPDAPWYEPEIRAFEAADAAFPPARGQILFIGSSSIRMWDSLARDFAPAPVLSRGFGGSKTPEVLAVFDRIVTPYRPAVIVYYCGDNDLGTDNTDAESAADGFVQFGERARAHWPSVHILYLPIKPSLARWSNWPAMQRANALVLAYCERTSRTTFLDTVAPTLTPGGTPDPAIFEPDGLHLNAKGYEIWTSVAREPVLAAWRNSRPPAVWWSGH